MNGNILFRVRGRPFSNNDTILNSYYTLLATYDIGTYPIKKCKSSLSLNLSDLAAAE